MKKTGINKSATDKSIEKLEPFRTACGNEKWYSCFGKQAGSLSNS